MIAAAISGVIYKPRNQDDLTDAAMLLRALADKVEEDDCWLVQRCRFRLDSPHAV